MKDSCIESHLCLFNYFKDSLSIIIQCSWQKLYSDYLIIILIIKKKTKKNFWAVMKLNVFPEDACYAPNYSNLSVGFSS